MQGKLLAIEGFDGVGKTILSEYVRDKLNDMGYKVHIFHEPSCNELYLDLAKKALNETKNQDSAALIFIAGRLEFYRNTVEKHLNNGEHVIMDRFIESTISYQCNGNEMMNDEICYDLHKKLGMRIPDRTFYLHADFDVCQERMKLRNNYEINGHMHKIHDLYHTVNNSMDFLYNKMDHIFKINTNNSNIDDTASKVIEGFIEMINS